MSATSTLILDSKAHSLPTATGWLASWAKERNSFSVMPSGTVWPVSRVPEEVPAQGAPMELRFALCRGAGHALDAQGARLVPVPHPGCPCPAPCSLCLGSSLRPSGSPAPLLGSLASAVSLIRASQPLQRGVGAPRPGVAPDKQLERLLAESVISKGNTETNYWSQGGRLIISHPGSRRPLHFPRPPASAPGTSRSPFQSQRHNVSSPQSLPWLPRPLTPCKLPWHTVRNSFLHLLH